jgi:hypothetical protein
VCARAEVKFHFQISGEIAFLKTQTRPKVTGFTEECSEAVRTIHRSGGEVEADLRVRMI